MLDYFSEYLSVIIGEWTKTCTTWTNRHRFWSYTRHYTMVGTFDEIKVRKWHAYRRPIQFMHTCLIISVNIYQWLLENERKHVQPGHRFWSYTRHYTMVGTYDEIKVRKLYSLCMPIQFMHICLIISLHGIVLFFGDYRIRRQIYVHM